MPPPPSNICPVQECQENADTTCDQCQLKFCSALHGPHTSHTCQQLKAGYSFKGNWVAPPIILGQEALTVSTSAEDLPTSSSSAVKNISSLPSASFEIVEQVVKSPSLSIDEEVNVISILGNSERTNQRSKRKHEETVSVHVPVTAIINTAVTDVAHRIQKLIKLAGPSVLENLKRELNFECYHVEFSIQLSNELNVDISGALDVRRPTRAGVMKELILKLL